MPQPVWHCISRDLSGRKQVGCSLCRDHRAESCGEYFVVAEAKRDGVSFHFRTIPVAYVSQIYDGSGPRVERFRPA